MTINLQDNKFYTHNWSLLIYFSCEISVIIDAERRIVNNSESFVNQLQDELKQNVKRDTAFQSFPKNEEQETNLLQYYDFLFRDFEIAISQIKQTQRRQTILSIFSIYEGLLYKICKIIQSEFDFPIKIEDLDSRSYTKKYWSYLTKVFQINSSKINNLFNSIEANKLIRNSIAHNNSIIEKDNKKTMSKNHGLKLLKINAEYEIQVEDIKYQNWLLDNIESLMIILLKEIDIRYVGLKK